MVFERGIMTALITPFRENGELDVKGLHVLIERQIKAGINGVLVCGTTGEGSTLSEAEYKKVIKESVKAAGKRIPVYVGAGSNSTKTATEKSKIAESLGADGLLQITPYYNKTNDSGVIRHFQNIADSTELPVYIYNVPSRTGYDIPVSAVRELSYHPKIAGIKEASGSVAKAAEILSCTGDGFSVFSGDDALNLPILSIGGKGGISVLSNLLPEDTVNICRLFFSGEMTEAGKLQVNLMPVIKMLFCEVNPIPVKTAMGLCGLPAGPLRLPLSFPDKERGEHIKDVLKRFGILKQ